MYTILSCFFIYAFLGWCCEVAFHTLTCGDFANRGFLFGPICPIYGFGAIAVVLVTEPFTHNLPLLFAVSIILTSALELVTGFVLDKIFHNKWWDYSNYPFNIGGYICPLFSLLWGFACVFIIKLVHPFLLFAVSLVPHVLGIVLLSVFSALFLADLTVTVMGILKFNKRLRALAAIAQELHDVSDKLGVKINDEVLEAMEKGEAAKERLTERKSEAEARREELEQRFTLLRAKYEKQVSEFRLSDRHLLHAFPKMKSHIYNTDTLRKKINELKNKKKS